MSCHPVANQGASGSPSLRSGSPVGCSALRYPLTLLVRKLTAVGCFAGAPYPCAIKMGRPISSMTLKSPSLQNSPFLQALFPVFYAALFAKLSRFSCSRQANVVSVESTVKLNTRNCSVSICPGFLKSCTKGTAGKNASTAGYKAFIL